MDGIGIFVASRGELGEPAVAFGTDGDKIPLMCRIRRQLQAGHEDALADARRVNTRANRDDLAATIRALDAWEDEGPAGPARIAIISAQRICRALGVAGHGF